MPKSPLKSILALFYALILVSLILTSSDRAAAQSENTNAGTNSNSNSTPGAVPNGQTETNGSSRPGAVSESGAGSTKPPCPKDDQPEATVKEVYRSNPDGIKTISETELGDVLVVEIENLQRLLDEAKCTDKQRNIVLYLDDQPMKGATPFPPTDPKQSSLKFVLARNEDSREAWAMLLGEPSWEARRVKVSAGIEDKYALASDSYINLTIIPHGWFIFWLLILGTILIIFLYLAHSTSLLRDPVTPENGAKRTYSLGRSQAAWWFFLIIAAYLFIGMITGDFSTTITGTVLALFGISAGTAVGSAFVDAGKNTTDETQRQISAALILKANVAQLKNEIETAENQKNVAQGALTTTPNDKQAQINLASAETSLAARRAEMEDKASQLNKLNNQSENFLRDILSDINGISFHRFQIVALTIVLGIIFIVQVYKFLAMPTFDGTLLALLGISAGTYLGFKIPENNVPKK